MGLFKMSIDPFSKVELTNANSCFVNPIIGSDSTGTGARENPFSTVTKAITAYGGSRIIILSGMSKENITTESSVTIIGSTPDSGFESYSFQSGGGLFNFFGLKISVLTNVFHFTFHIDNCKIDSFKFWSKDIYLSSVRNSFIKKWESTDCGNDYGPRLSNNIIFEFYNYINNSTIRYIYNHIFLNVIDLYNFTSINNVLYYPIFKYCLFRYTTIWKWNGSIIPINYGTYGNAPGDYLADVISAMYAYTNTIAAGTDRTYFSAMFPNAVTSPIFYVDQNSQTCKVVEDRPSVAGSKKIFNRYVGDNPVDYSLFLHADNVALIMSDELSYVGCYKANADVLTFSDVISVNEDGSDDLITPPDMLIYDGNGKFRVSIADSVQIRNRVRSSVFHFKRGFTLDGFQSQMKSGLASRFSLGKFQPYNITDAPTLPQESIEVIPYDDAVTPSAFPRFSAMFNDKVQMWYHTAGAKKDLPVLFNDLLADFAIVTDKSLAEYGAWAVTNADYETFALSTKANVKLQNVPVYFAQVEINLNYHV